MRRKSSQSRKNDSCQEADKKVSHLAWKIKGRASVCGTKFMYLQCEGEKV
jgi:hypothetical protein